MLTIALGITPYVPYVAARRFGNLPSEAEWFARGGNHGPWWSSAPHRSLILFPLLGLTGLPLVTLPLAAWLSIVKKRPELGNGIVVLGCVQWFLAVLNIMTVFWTID